MKKQVITIGLVLVSASVLFAGGEPRPDLVAQVAAGKIAEAHASWWGFDPADSTAYLQAALSSGVRRLIIDKMPSAWVVTPLRGASDQELVFDPGAEIVAKSGSFTNRSDCLITYRRCHNISISGYGGLLRMRHKDYMQPPYAHSEWRHALSFLSCSNIVIRGLTIASSGGDGIYLGCNGKVRKNTDIVIRDVLCVDNHRQGISVISAENLLVENTVLRDTFGTAPAAGIDFEPNAKDEVIRNCVMRNCQSVNNQGAGYHTYLGPLNSTSVPYDLRFENCTAYGNKKSFNFACNSRTGRDAAGKVTIDRCLFERPRTRTAVDLRENRCGTLKYDIRDSRIVQTNEFGFDEVVLMDEAWRKIHLPHEADPDFAIEHIVDPDYAHAEICDAAPGKSAALSPVRIRHRGTYLVYADSKRIVRFTGCQSRVGRNAPATTPMIVTALNGRQVAKIKLPDWKDAAFSFAAPAAGFYRIKVNVGANAFIMKSSDAPVALDLTLNDQSLIACNAKLWMSVPKDVKTLALYASGEGNEKVRVSLASPQGTTVWDQDNVERWEKFVQRKDIQSGLWCLGFSRPSQGAFEDFRVDMAGIPGFLFLSREKTWTCAAQ